MQKWNGKWGEPDHHEHTTRLGGFFVVRPAGHNYLEVKVLYLPGKGKG